MMIVEASLAVMGHGRGTTPSTVGLAHLIGGPKAQDTSRGGAFGLQRLGAELS
jgi:hypothetical protein